MPWLNLSDISNMIGGMLYGDDVPVEGVSIDSRTLRDRDLFIALSGERFDGHSFAEQALAAGAAGILTARKLELAAPQIIVHDTFQALWEFARRWRDSLRLRMIALTGSNGKTTTREMLSSIFKREEVLVTRGNLNNHIGVPLTLLNLRKQHRVGVIEIGANHTGEVRQLAQLIKPDIGLVTNAASAHLGGFGSLDAVAAAKGELFEVLAPDAIGIVNADSSYCDYWRSLLADRRVVSFGIDQPADVQGKFDPGATVFTLAEKMHALNLTVPGLHNFQNALAAVATAYSAGVDINAITKGLEDFTAIPGRMTFMPGIHGTRLIDDSYNANPESLQAALDVLRTCPEDKWLVLGDMQELGSDAFDLHTDAGRMAKAAGVQRLFTVGNLAKAAADSFGSSSRHFEDLEELIEYLVSVLVPNTVILVKGSRSARLETVIAALQETEESKC